MNNDFKKSSYILTILLFFIGIVALVAASAAKYFSFDELVVTVSQIVSLLSFFVIFINCIHAKSKYNTACIRFADYILTNRRKEAERKTADEERAQEMQNIMSAAGHDREKAVEAALRQGRSEGAQSAAQQPDPAQQGGIFGQPVINGQAPANRQQMPVAQPQQVRQPIPAAQPVPVQMPVQAMPNMRAMPMPMPIPQQGMVMPPQYMAAPQPPMQQRNYRDDRDAVNAGNEEMLYNEYGEPVMVRRRVRKTSSSPDGELLYDGQGNPVIRRNQGLWEPLEQRHEIVLKVETAPGVSVSQPSRFTPNSVRGDEERTDE